MSRRALRRNLHIPVGVHAETGEPVTVLHLLEDAPPHLRPEDLPREDRVALVAHAWHEGLWADDVSIDGESPLGLGDAIDEVMAGTPNGELLLKTALRALEMLREHVASARARRERE